jgi:hypothetical protein
VRIGGTYRTGGLALEVDGLTQVPVGDLTDADAQAAGDPDLAALLKRFPGATVVWRVDFRTVTAPPPVAVSARLTPTEVADIGARLARLDRTSKVGPWTEATLVAIAEHPGLVSTELAVLLGRARFDLKDDIRKLKRLGLTESLVVGYDLSPRGETYLVATGARKRRRRRGPPREATRRGQRSL